MATKAGNSPWWFINISILIALIMTIMPLPIQVKSLWPDWAVLVVLYWAIALPHRVSIGVAWFVGFLLDILLGTVLGVHAFSLAIITFGVASNFQKLRNFSVWQQSFFIGVFLAAYHFFVFLLNKFLLNVDFSASYFTPALSSALIWLWLFPLLRAYRRKFKIR